jgi:hypothetical protein
MTPLTQHQKELITKNVLAACRDITKLNKTGYDFLYLASGFIAHYNLQGFIAHYSDHNLQKDIESNTKANQWNNFRNGERDADYYHAKRDCYNMILGGLVAREALNEKFGHPMEFLRTHFTIIRIG